MPKPKLTWRQRQARAQANARDWDTNTAVLARETHLTGITTCWADKTAIAWLDGEPVGAYETYAEALAALPAQAQARLTAEGGGRAAAFFARSKAEEPADPLIDRHTEWLNRYG